MACLGVLKQEIQAVSAGFPSDHGRFAITSATVDELTCRFIDHQGKKHVIHANITETYPSTPPVWFSESEDSQVTVALTGLSETSGLDNHLLHQVRRLIRQLCAAFSVPEPPELKRLDEGYYNPAPPAGAAADGGGPHSHHAKHHHHAHLGAGSSSASHHAAKDAMASSDDDLMEDEEEDSEDEDEIALDMEDVENVSKKARQEEEIHSEHVQVLERLKAKQRGDYLKGTVSGSVQATDRLMKELRDIYKSPSFKSGSYQVELVNDSLYEWNVKIMRVDPDSPLADDLRKLKEKEGKDHILLSFMFKDTFPFDPPFVRMVHPVLHGGYVLDGGALCMELMTPQGWSSAYTVEAVIMQLSATLVKGKARIKFDAPRGTYSLARAQQSFRSLVHIHEKNGWFTPPQADG
ncbi:hypothetical protein TCAL_09694 [Tigriopus californicus]|uniref:UBC core domain-containing protein n=1 Tax=Tigriopus californicus TaxID=6832 RepID=A0A553NNH6_TIGCA|nr:ubiquitin-conjugating enzyme E2 Q2-like [Tigriopus californicus]TRY66998.1 hypothetical protein TCAL_09694 [Tigriopus californicus]|eukprot:TCALIF_09694-PA protein Name:"Similar to UBE2Q2 Ubiquitin-conjugating enzyme E2 Q2 (Homo sapiens)" AED:0.05 eAED:0.05 QI:418/1/1/1/1/1/7/592/406